MTETMAKPGEIYADRFRVEEFIDSGIMGSVFRAVQLDKQRVVALKVINAELAEDPEIIKRFHREMRVTAAIKHPNTVRVHQYGHTPEGELYLAMELLEGHSLDELIRQGPMSAGRAGRLGGQIARALEAAHAEGVIHRDLKPENIMVVELEDGTEWVKVLDFGLARATDSDGGEEQLTAYGARVGTPFYMAPEYVQTFDLDHRSDLYGLGVLMFEMLTGQPPFKGGPYEVLHKHVREAPPRFFEVVEGLDVPMWMEELVFQLLEKDPARRPQTAEAVVQRLEGYLELPVAPQSEIQKKGGTKKLAGGNAPAMIAAAAAIVGVLILGTVVGLGLLAVLSTGP